MPLSQKQLTQLSAMAQKAALLAGNLITRNSAKQLNCKIKQGGESYASQVVTEVDFLCQETILKTLAPSFQEFDFALLTEEMPDDRQRLTKDYFWCIDPMDGTLPFIRSQKGYSVSIALVSNSSQVQLGVVYDPLSKTLYHAVHNQGLYKNQQRYHPCLQPLSSNTPLTVIFDPNFENHPYHANTLQQLQVVTKKLGFSALHRFIGGGAVMNACWVLENSPACFFKYPKTSEGGGSSWDFAATSCLFNEAAAIITDMQGLPLRLNQAETTFMNKSGVLYCSHQNIAAEIKQLYRQISQKKFK